jgi:hypothetical protein
MITGLLVWLESIFLDTSCNVRYQTALEANRFSVFNGDNMKPNTVEAGPESKGWQVLIHIKGNPHEHQILSFCTDGGVPVGNCPGLRR